MKSSIMKYAQLVGFLLITQQRVDIKVIRFFQSSHFPYIFVCYFIAHLKVLSLQYGGSLQQYANPGEPTT